VKFAHRPLWAGARHPVRAVPRRVNLPQRGSRVPGSRAFHFVLAADQLD